MFYPALIMLLCFHAGVFALYAIKIHRKLSINNYEKLQPLFDHLDWQTIQPLLERLPSWRIPSVQCFFKDFPKLSSEDRQRIRHDTSHSIMGAYQTLEMDGFYWFAVFLCLVINVSCLTHEPEVSLAQWFLWSLGMLLHLGFLSVMIRWRVVAHRKLRLVQVGAKHLLDLMADKSGV